MVEHRPRQDHDREHERGDADENASDDRVAAEAAEQEVGVGQVPHVGQGQDAWKEAF